MSKEPRIYQCKLCKGSGEIGNRPFEYRCPDCEGEGFVEDGSEIRAQQLKIERVKKK